MSPECSSRGPERNDLPLLIMAASAAVCNAGIRTTPSASSESRTTTAGSRGSSLATSTAVRSGDVDRSPAATVTSTSGRST